MAKILKPLPPYPFKLEVGSGGMPHPGYVHLDYNATSPHVEIQCEMGAESIPLPDGSVSEILSNHSIEHVMWPRVGNLLRDWNRILIPGGKLFLRTPDLEFICRTYLEGKTTREAPQDESNMVSVFGDCGPAEWACIKLFAGQDYPGNVHYFCFDFQMLKRTLERYGFEKVVRVYDQPVFSPGEIQCYAYKK